MIYKNVVYNNNRLYVLEGNLRSGVKLRHFAYSGFLFENYNKFYLTVETKMNEIIGDA